MLLNRLTSRRKLAEFSWLVFMLMFSGLAFCIYTITALLYLENINSIADFMVSMAVKGGNNSLIYYSIVPSVITGKYLGTYIWAKIMRKFKFLDEATIKEMGG